MLSVENIELAKATWAEISKAKKVLLHLHSRTDGDSVGSTIAFKKVLEKIGKRVDVISGDNKFIPKFLRFLPGVEEIMIKEFKDLDWGEYDLFVSLDSASLTQVSRAENFSIDVNKTVVIDHHKSNTKYGKINLVDINYVAVCEILVDFFKVVGAEIPQDAAVCLYVGICTDSGNFNYPPTSFETLRKASDLCKINPDCIKVNSMVASSIDLTEFRCRNKAFLTLEFWKDGLIGVCKIKKDDLISDGCYTDEFGPSEVALIVSKLDGTIAGICLYEKDDKTWLSFRSKDSAIVNVRQYAEKFPIGGGHDAAAGATFPGKLEEALEFLKSII